MATAAPFTSCQAVRARPRRRAYLAWGAALAVALAGVAPTWGQGERRLAERRVAVILAPRHETVLSAEVPGRVVALTHEMGQRFAVGDVLARLDALTYRAELATAEARLAAAEIEQREVRKLAEQQTRRRHAEAVLTAARANLAATQSLHDDGHASQVDLENARRDVKTAEADVELVLATAAKELAAAERAVIESRARVDIARRNLERCTLRAPFAGRVRRVAVNEHEQVERGTAVIEIVDDRVLLAKFLLPSSMFNDVEIGQDIVIEVSEVGRAVRGRISHMAAVLDPASVTFEVYAEIDNQDERLRAGMNGWLRLDSLPDR